MAPFFEHTDQLFNVDGFGEIIVHSLCEAFFSVLAGSVGCHGDDEGLVAIA